MLGGSRATAVRMAVLALLWGSGFLWIKVALNGGLAPLHITVVRCVLGAAALLVLARAAGERLPRERRVWGHLVVAALFCNAVPFFLFAVGEQTVDSGVAGVLNATTPLWSLAIGIVSGTERALYPLRLLGLGLGFGGTLLIFAPWQHGGSAGWGAAALLGAAVGYAVAFAYMARYLIGRGGAPLALSAAQLLCATGLTALALPLGPTDPGAPTVTGVLAVVVLGILGTGVTFHLNSRLIADEGPTAAATVGYLLPVVSVTLGALVLDEALSVRVVAGMVVVLVGVGLTRARGRTPAPEVAPGSATAGPATAGPARAEEGPVAAVSGRLGRRPGAGADDDGRGVDRGAVSEAEGEGDDLARGELRGRAEHDVGAARGHAQEAVGRDRQGRGHPHPAGVAGVRVEAESRVGGDRCADRDEFVVGGAGVADGEVRGGRVGVGGQVHAAVADRELGGAAGSAAGRPGGEQGQREGGRDEGARDGLEQGEGFHVGS